MDHIEKIFSSQNEVLCILIKKSCMPEQTTFITPPDYKQQVGFVVYPSGGEIKRHMHLPLKRQLVGTSEVLIVRKGRCLIDIYDGECKLEATRELTEGDIMLMVGGGHGFRMTENTVFLEVKQGPYTGIEEKERF
jgi:hypothetical protein